MTDPAARVQELLDRQDILDCIHKTCRAFDRLDADLIDEVYHEDAFDDHGRARGTKDEFRDWAFAHHKAAHAGSHHYVTNHTCELDGDVAHTETYYVMVGQNLSGTPLSLHGGRYVDRLEKRDGTWKIALRKSLLEWVGALGPVDLPATPRVQPGVIARDRTDASYERPLTLREG